MSELLEAIETRRSTDASAFLKAMHPEGVFEIRALECPFKPGGDRKCIQSGYFDSMAHALREVRKVERLKPRSIHVTVNRCRPAMLAKRRNKMERAGYGDTTSDTDIDRRLRLYIDIDAVTEVTKVSATDAESECARDVALAIRDELETRGWAAPILGMSGNGYCLVYAIDLPNDPESLSLVGAVLESLSKRHPSAGVKIDQSVKSAGQLMKLLGTWARKGEDFHMEGQPSRPHRQSWHDIPEGFGVDIVTVEQMKAFAAFAAFADVAEAAGESPNEVRTANAAFWDENNAPKRQYEKIDIKAWVAERGIPVKGPFPYKGGEKWVFSELPLPCEGSPSGHTDVAACIYDLPDGQSAKCSHAQCKWWGLKDLLDRYGRPTNAQKVDSQRKEKPAPNAPPADGNWIRVKSNRNENSLATRFIDEYHDSLRYVPQWRKWLVWDGMRWQIDADATRVLRLARVLTNDLWADFAKAATSATRDELAKLQAFCKAANRSQGAQAIINLGRADSRVCCNFDELNADPYLFNVRNGTVDLRTGELREHQQADLITQVANVGFDADAECPGWDSTLGIVFDGNTNLIRYVGQILGYSISGDIGEHILPIAYGNGNNGKSTIWNAVLELAGDYGVTADDSLLLGSRQNHPTEKAQLYQKRIVAIAEPEQGSQLRESRVKELTGDKFITARRMKEDFWQFTRTHKFWLATNHLPEISGTDTGIWRRVKLIPFTVDISTKVTPVANYATWLVENEGAGILNWLIAGFRTWQAEGFGEPLAVKEATKGYRGEQDHIGQFLADCCVVSADAVVGTTDLYDAYSGWGGRWKPIRFGTAVCEKFKKDRANEGALRNRMCYFGVGIQTGLIASKDTPSDGDAFFG